MDRIRLAFYFAPLQGSLRETLIVLGLLAMVGLLVALRWRQVGLQRRRLFRERLEQLRARARECHMEEEDFEDLVAAIKLAQLRDPMRAAESEGVFDRLVAPRLEEVAGRGVASEVRMKLFLSPEPQRERNYVYIPRGMSDRETDRAWSKVVERNSAAPHSATPTDTAASSGALASTLAFKVGMELSLSIGTRDPVRSKVDLVTEGSLRVGMPLPVRERLDPKPGEPVEGHFLREGTYHLLRTRVAPSPKHEAHGLRLEHSSEIHPIQRREFERARLELAFRFARLPKEGGREVLQGVLQDISAGGCAVVLQDEGTPAAEGETVAFPVAIPGEAEPVRVRGRVIHTSIARRGGGARVRLHVQFQKVDETLRQRLVEAVDRMRQREAAV